jgi:hypothetical protein
VVVLAGRLSLLLLGVSCAEPCAVALVHSRVAWVAGLSLVSAVVLLCGWRVSCNGLCNNGNKHWTSHTLHCQLSRCQPTCVARVWPLPQATCAACCQGALTTTWESWQPQINQVKLTSVAGRSCTGSRCCPVVGGPLWLLQITPCLRACLWRSG